MNRRQLLALSLPAFAMAALAPGLFVASPAAAYSLAVPNRAAASPSRPG